MREEKENGTEEKKETGKRPSYPPEKRGETPRCQQEE